MFALVQAHVTCKHDTAVCLPCRVPMEGANLLNVLLAMAASLSVTGQTTVDPKSITVTAIYYIVQTATTVGRRLLVSIDENNLCGAISMFLAGCFGSKSWDMPGQQGLHVHVHACSSKIRVSGMLVEVPHSPVSRSTCCQPCWQVTMH